LKTALPDFLDELHLRNLRLSRGRRALLGQARRQSLTYKKIGARDVVGAVSWAQTPVRLPSMIMMNINDD
jgi:hypothetical protein